MELLFYLFQHLHGKFAVHPFVRRLIPIIADTMVTREFATGAVKITPAHDMKDYECGKRHNLPFITIFTLDGSINENGGEFRVRLTINVTGVYDTKSHLYV
jgi:valyl-tRNA synthetase